MYLNFYGLREAPFSLTPDPEFFFLSAGHQQALSYLSYGILERKGFLQLTGEVGSGKTMLIRRLLEEVGDTARTAYILNPADTFTALLQFILKDLEVPLPASAEPSKTALLDALYTFLLARRAEGVPVILIFDEAQNLSTNVLEEIRLISNFETNKEKLIQIVFVGQPEFRDMIASPELRQLAQRIAIRYHLAPLLRDETGAYVDHRLRIAGGERVHITAMAKDLIYTYTGGVPRLANVLCDYALLVGYVHETFVINHRLLNQAIIELEGRARPAQGGEAGAPSWLKHMHQPRRRGRRIHRARRIVSDAQTIERATPTPSAETPPPARVPAATPAPAQRSSRVPPESPVVPMRAVVTAARSEPVATPVPARPAAPRVPVARAPINGATSGAPSRNGGAATAVAEVHTPPPVRPGALKAALAAQTPKTPPAAARPRRVISPEEAQSLAAQALGRGRPARAAVPKVARASGNVPVSDDWWKQLPAGDTESVERQRGMWAALRRWWRWVFGR